MSTSTSTSTNPSVSTTTSDGIDHGKRSTKATTSPPGPERFHVLVITPVGGLYVVAAGNLVVGIYHEGHDPMPDPAYLGRAVGEAGGNLPESVAVASAVNSSLIMGVESVLRRASQELREYFDGHRQSFDFPVASEGTAFQEDVWQAIAQIPFGARRSYRDLAGSLGNPAMGRAVGAAVRANPLSIVIPGHRVVSSSGKVIGYAAGTGVKSALLEFERSLCAPPERSESPAVDDPPSPSRG